ncbi:Cytochrome c oxidase subunit 2 [Paraglaciecola mesophila]|uniref:Cytochrome c oxidase subunit 2 n=2 Tax=Paraglaciecola mesophila TaxID=197222 RepID=A0A857JS85_9ALTE|nr:Cytochrome c oxidase subunit 2 [Paraglaciecola mesophila]
MQKMTIFTSVFTIAFALSMPLSVTFSAALSIWTFPSHAETPEALRERQEQGKTLMITKGCSSCHQLTKLPPAKGLVGPPLDNMAAQSYIAGVLPNSRENLTQFLLDPQKFHADSAMPTPDITQQEALRLVDYLWKE